MHFKSFASSIVMIACAAVAPTLAQEFPLPMDFLPAANGGLGLEGPDVFKSVAQAQGTLQCWSLGEIVQFVRSSGFEDVQLHSRDHRSIVVTARQSLAPYFVSVDPCRGRIVEAVRMPDEQWSYDWSSTSR